MKLPILPPRTSLKGKRVLVRVDWNIPLEGEVRSEDSLKLTRTYQTITSLSERGAIVLVMTHLGRPKGRESKYSTRKLLEIAQCGLGKPVQFLSSILEAPRGLAEAQEQIHHAKAGAIFLLENVRFYPGEETNAPKLAKAFASLADLFMNDAFASCHRAHASVVGVTKFLPSWAGPSLVAEVEGLSHLLKTPKRPFVAVIGGAKLSTKMDVLTALLSIADRVMVGGAMAHPFFVAQRKEVGRSFVEKEAVKQARKLLKHPKLMLPMDVVVTSSAQTHLRPRVVMVGDIKKRDMIGDIGTETMRKWSEVLKTAKTIVWNGPVGVTEFPEFSHGSRVIAQAVAARSKGPCFGVVGGGDTLPIMLQSGMAEWVDHLSTGGGAMLEFLAKHGKLAGLVALEKSSVRGTSTTSRAKEG